MADDGVEEVRRATVDEDAQLLVVTCGELHKFFHDFQDIAHHVRLGRFFHLPLHSLSSISIFCYTLCHRFPSSATLFHQFVGDCL